MIFWVIVGFGSLLSTCGFLFRAVVRDYCIYVNGVNVQKLNRVLESDSFKVRVCVVHYTKRLAARLKSMGLF